MESFKPRDKLILMHRFGFIDGIPKTQEEVGILLNLLSNSIAYIESRALRKLRSPNRNRKIEEYRKDDCLYIPNSSRKI